jgi:enoyl-CoA hydratase
MTMTATTPHKTLDAVSGSGLDFELRDRVGILTFNRPEVMNAIDMPLYVELVRVVREIEARSDIHVLILQGAGRAFCAGGDISFMEQMHTGEASKDEANLLGLQLFRALVSLPQPTISVVNGPAIGLGATIALCCDLIFASDTARIADPHVQMGLVAGDGGPVIWPMLIGAAKAKEFLFTGDIVRAEQALELGLVNHVYPVDEVHERAFAFAQRIANGPTRAIQATKALVNFSLRTMGEQVVTQGLALERVSQESEYHHMAVERFLAGDPIRF